MDCNKNLHYNKLINIVHWNSNCINNNLHQLPYFVNKYNIDILVNNETKLTIKNNCFLQGYNCYWRDRVSETRGFGVAFFMKNNIPHYEFPPNTNTLEAHAIKIPGNILLVSCYNHPQNRIDLIDLKNFFKLNNKVIILGDLNAKHSIWHCQKSTKNGTFLSSFLQKNPVHVLYLDLTLFPSNKAASSIVDISLIKNISKINKPLVIHDLDSDHMPVQVIINNSYFITEIVTLFNYKKANWHMFDTILNKNTTINSKIVTKLDIEKSGQNLTDHISKALDISILKIKLTPKTSSLPTEILKHIKIKNYHRRKYQQSHRLADKLIYYSYIQQVKIAITKHNDNTISNKLKNFNIKDNSLWNAIKVAKKTNNIVPTLITDEGAILNNSDKADAIAGTFDETPKLTNDYSNPNTEKIVNFKYYDSILNALDKNTVYWVY